MVLNLARLYAESGDMQHAVKAIEAVPVDGRTPKMEFTLGALYDQLKQPKDAIAAYERAVDLEPGDLQTMDALAQSLLNNDQLDEALKQYQAISEADPENAEALIHIGEIERRQGKYEDALATVHKARKLDPNSLEAGFNEGLLLDILNRLDDAVQTYQEMVDATSHANGAYTDEEKNNRSIFLERLGTILRGAEQDRSGRGRVPEDDRPGRELGRARLPGASGRLPQRPPVRQGPRSRPQGGCERSQRSRPEADAGRRAGRPGHPDEALAWPKVCLTAPPPTSSAASGLAIAQMNVRLHRWKDAEDALDKGEPLATKKEDRTYLFFLRGEWAERQKHLDQAEQYFNQALELDPENAMTLNYLGYMWADKGVKLPDALKMIRKAVSIEPMNGAFLDSLGWVYFKMGEYELAEDNLRQAVNRDQTDPTVHMHLGDLYEKTGRIRLAAAQWELALDGFAKSSPADVEPGDVAKVQKKLESARMRLAKQEDTVGPAKPE